MSAGTTQPSIAVVGSINMDVAVRTARLPVPGETVRGGEALLSLGGKGANQAVAAARLGAIVRMIGGVGDDAFGGAALEALAGEAVDLTGVKCWPGAATGVALITVGGDGQNMITLSPGANARLSSAEVASQAALLSGCKVLLLQNETPPEAAHAAIQLLKDAIVIADPAPAAGFDPDLIASADIVTPNESEATLLTGVAVRDQASALEAARRLVALGAGTALVKLGAAGVVHAGRLDGGEGEGHVPAPAVTAVDTVAAGDCFNGALAVALAEGARLREALAFACRAAAIAVTRPGASASMPRRAEMG